MMGACRTPDVFVAYKLRKGEWVPTKLRVTSFALERLDADGARRPVQAPCS